MTSPSASSPSEIDVKSEADRMILAVSLLASVDLAGLVETIERAHTLGPLIDPTAYREALYRGDMDTVCELAAALLRPVKIFNERIAPLLPKAPSGG